MTPDAEILNQKTANKLSIEGNLIILCGHYKGVDQRVRDKLINNGDLHWGLRAFGRRASCGSIV